MKVPSLDLKAPCRELRDGRDAACRRGMESGWFVLGEDVEAFEGGFAKYCETGHCVGVAKAPFSPWYQL